MLWYVKSKRARSKDDDESWNEGGVTPTLNAFDMGDTRATVIAFYSTDGGFGAKDDNLAPSTKVGGVTAMTDKLVVRRLTPTECERLQGFPDGWTEGQSESSRYKQMGNAVAVPVVEWIMERLVRFDEMV